MKKISIVVACYNEERMIKMFSKKINDIFKTIKYQYEIIFINDGSSDDTLNIMLEVQKYLTNVLIINLSRNFGKEAALTAGIDYASGDALIPIDIDLQDPPELIHELISMWEKGNDVVLAKRIDRKSDTLLKRLSALLFYKIQGKLTDIKIPENVGDFRLISRKVVNALHKLPENQRYMKGIFAWVGFKTTTITYSRQSRKYGKSKFDIWKLWNLALSGITSFSTTFLRIWLYIGFFVSLLSFLYGIFIIAKTLIYGSDLPGYPSLITVILFLGGIQLMGIGVLGEYIGRIFLETKRRPVYIVENIYE